MDDSAEHDLLFKQVIAYDTLLHKRGIPSIVPEYEDISAYSNRELRDLLDSLKELARTPTK